MLDTQIVNALGSRTATFLAEKEWMTLPWRDSIKSVHHELLDLMAKIPSILEQAQSITYKPEAHEILSSTLSLIEKCWDLNNQFQEWKRKFPMEEKPLWRLEVKNQTDNESVSDLNNLCPVILSFDDICTAHMYILYWSSLIFLHGLMPKVYRSLHGDPEDSYSKTCLVCSQPENSQTCYCGSLHLFQKHLDFDVSVLPPLTEEMNVQGHALNIVQSTDYFMRPQFGPRSPGLVIFPLLVAMQHFMSHPGNELIWCHVIFKRLNDCGYPLGSILSKLQWRQYPPSLE
jgi:hypothetical protein